MAKKSQLSKVSRPDAATSIAALAFWHSVGVVAYIILVSLFMSNAEKIFGGQEDTFLAPVAFLLVFTLSAAVVGLLVLGRPVMLYLDGKRREAMNFAGMTIGFLAIEALLIFICLAISNA